MTKTSHNLVSDFQIAIKPHSPSLKGITFNHNKILSCLAIMLYTWIIHKEHNKRKVHSTIETRHHPYSFSNKLKVLSRKLYFSSPIYNPNWNNYAILNHITLSTLDWSLNHHLEKFKSEIYHNTEKAIIHHDLWPSQTI